ncbi:unnamed protein product [Lymnaea stagnalis]|uniref:Uncharacterized protein n=1 Tax=Lymnaea stagnalis TaxID=6523 RepID=A0AAV2IBZ9_LYMST
MYARLPGMLLFGLGLFSVIRSKYADPTLRDLLRIKCKGGKPNICLPYGICCRPSQFCYNGLCETCFDATVRHLPREEKRQWCRDYGQHNVSLMRHSTCGMACQSLFTSNDLSTKINDTSLQISPVRDHEVNHVVYSNTGVLVLGIAVTLQSFVIAGLILVFFKNFGRKSIHKVYPAIEEEQDGRHKYSIRRKQQVDEERKGMSKREIVPLVDNTLEPNDISLAGQETTVSPVTENLNPNLSTDVFTSETRL